MSYATSQGPNLLNGFKRLTKFETGIGSQLPEAYKKFWREWKLTTPTAVHYIPKEGKWERDEITGEIKPIQNHPLPLIDPPESNQGIWGGEAVIKGFQKRNPLKRRVPHFWVPVLRRSVVHSKILNEHMSVVVTNRTINLIHESQGFDHYLLKSLACDLRSTLAFTLKRKMLQALENGCQHLQHDEKQRNAVLNEYSKYLEAYTAEDIEWYGLTYNEAIKKLQAKITAQNPVIPQKYEFRSKLINQLRNAGIAEAGSDDAQDVEVQKLSMQEPSSSNWLSKINPFGKKHET